MILKDLMKLFFIEYEKLSVINFRLYFFKNKFCIERSLLTIGIYVSFMESHYFLKMKTKWNGSF